jgi:hypothetical protein
MNWHHQHRLKAGLSNSVSPLCWFPRIFLTAYSKRTLKSNNYKAHARFKPFPVKKFSWQIFAHTCCTVFMSGLCTFYSTQPRHTPNSMRMLYDNSSRSKDNFCRTKHLYYPNLLHCVSPIPSVTQYLVSTILKWNKICTLSQLSFIVLFQMLATSFGLHHHAENSCQHLK